MKKYFLALVLVFGLVAGAHECLGVGFSTFADCDKQIEAAEGLKATGYVESGKQYLIQGQVDLAKEYFTKAYNLYKAIGDNSDAQWVYEIYLK